MQLTRFYLQLIKTPQTGLLLFTALAGYLGSDGSLQTNTLLLALLGLLLAVSGTTAVNMVFDRDIDALMGRTRERPLPAGHLTQRAATLFGTALILAGMALNFWIDTLYALMVLIGIFADFIIYTIWLKRRSPWSIIFGGIAGGMPILAGRVLAIGAVDGIGLLMGLSILLWIPTHILTLAMNHSDDYRLAGVPVFPNVFGFVRARYFIALANLLAAGIFMTIFYLLDIPRAGLMVLRIGSLLLVILSLRLILNPSRETNFTLFKFASIYMAAAMLIMII
jgi:heme o synthase